MLACHPFMLTKMFCFCMFMILFYFIFLHQEFKALGDLDWIQLRCISLPVAQQNMLPFNNNYPWGSTFPIIPLSCIQQIPSSPQHLPVNWFLQGRRSSVSVSPQRAYWCLQQGWNFTEAMQAMALTAPHLSYDAPLNHMHSGQCGLGPLSGWKGVRKT